MSKVQLHPPHFGGFRAAEFPARALRAFGRGARSFVEAIQTGRMISVLNAMSETQLAELGIERGEIPSYAARLVSGSGTGERTRASGK